MASAATSNGGMSRPTAEPELDLVTLGILILDDVDFLPPKPPVRAMAGGAGLYAALGARLFSPPPASSSIGWIVDLGHDFPPPLKALIQSWDTSAVLRSTPERATTRAWSGYNSNGQKACQFVTPARRLTGADLEGRLLWAKCFHMICAPARCKDLVSEIMAMRISAASATRPVSKPIFIWEPVPDMCRPDELESCIRALRSVDVFSPNHVELARYIAQDGFDPETDEISAEYIELGCEQLRAHSHTLTIVVRAAERGCYVASPGSASWIPAFHRDPSRVADPTGGGNAFLGGLAVGLARGKTIEEAAAWGTVAASFVIEQVGTAALSNDESGNETWNGTSVYGRLRELQSRQGVSPNMAEVAGRHGE